MSGSSAEGDRGIRCGKSPHSHFESVAETEDTDDKCLKRKGDFPPEDSGRKGRELSAADGVVAASMRRCDEFVGQGGEADDDKVDSGNFPEFVESHRGFETEGERDGEGRQEDDAAVKDPESNVPQGKEAL